MKITFEDGVLVVDLVSRRDVLLKVIDLATASGHNNITIRPSTEMSGNLVVRIVPLDSWAEESVTSLIRLVAALKDRTPEDLLGGEGTVGQLGTMFAEVASKYRTPANA